MPKFSIIEIGTSGVDMKVNPLFLNSTKAAHARNLTFNEATIRTRPDIEYCNLGLQGQFQGSTHFTPSFGLSATSYSEAPSALATVVDGRLYFNTIDDCGVTKKPQLIDGAKFDGDTYLYSAENYLIATNENNATYWWKSGTTLTQSPGIALCNDEANTHDTFDNEEHRHWLPCHATVGHYIHGRNHLSVDFAGEGVCRAMNSELFVSDILTKRGCNVSDDILKMEEAMLDSFGGTLVAPSRMGRTVAMETMPIGDVNGEGVLVDFRKCGVVVHDTLSSPRETSINKAGELMTQGWTEKRITNVKLQTVSATGRYAVYQLPDDIWFRSDYGFHFLKKTLGTGTLKDESLNHESHDIQPLIDIDENNDLSGAATGHWIQGSRFMGTVGFHESVLHSSSPMGRGIAVMNQAVTFTEDDTPRPQWDGLWTPDCDMIGIHKFTKAGADCGGKNFGIVASDRSANVYYGELKRRTTGYDTRDNELIPIPFEYVTGAFAFSGTRVIDTVRSGVIDMVTDESTGPVKISIRSDEQQCWQEWAVINPCTSCKSLVSEAFGEPVKSVREGTWFQFKIEGEGYIDIRTFDVTVVKVKEKDDGRKHCVPLCSCVENYFDCD